MPVRRQHHMCANGLHYERTIDGVEVLFRLIVQFLGLALQLREAPFCIDIDRIFCVLADIKALLELLRRSSYTFGESFYTHCLW
jgi:hypothetical protein